MPQVYARFAVAEVTMNSMQILYIDSIALRFRRVATLLMLTLLTACSTVPSMEAQAPARSAARELDIPVALAASQEQRFARWVQSFIASARSTGVDEATLQTAFSDVRLVPRAIDADRAQPEFTRSIWEYLDSALSAQRVSRGQAHLVNLRATGGVNGEAIAARYGVPLEVLVAIWGVESNFGAFMGDIPAIDALATLGFEGRREAWARDQLMAALRILQRQEVVRSQLVGSWAGAMGQTQFLPTAYLAYAVDGDGDGRRDIWRSLPDVLASTANFLSRSGWQRGLPWGVEVRLPAGFDYMRAEADVRQPSAAWQEMGVQSMDGAPLPVLPDCAILLPAGAQGPAFMVGANFRTILRYNNATSYALAVHLLAQRIAGGATLQAAWPRGLTPLARSQVFKLQTALNARGFNTGTPDGMVGPATQRGVRQFQQSLGLPADGYPTTEMLLLLQ